ncbi:hypothetical protein [Actinoplanes subtropicus]|uniref:hypothetical protein n=1 Tax=Actinoplanes subtropicus TaxID=543632 RepID=UPI0005554770|nr:hypothetical protein [Actinoplanes subtropicus]
MTTDRTPPRRRGYAKPVVVPDRLDLLSGPVSGVVTLPGHLKRSGNPRYDLDQPGRIVDMYRSVINEAAAPTDLTAYLDRATLVELWADMWLPLAVREQWEDRFPELAARRSHSAA